MLRSQLRDPSYYCTGSEARQQTSRSAEGQGSWELYATDWCEDADDWGRYADSLVLYSCQEVTVMDTGTYIVANG